ncbi:ion transporter [Cellvibrio sp. NN19]|uniref:ion transporter n=1 Tax=Cellvibrio chitinivorans TaxID=3102792 RepID=UPI002B405424|nr:ion transporter [Cellvibrio sp. NN19]
MKETLRERIYRIIFGTDTPAGKLFDVLLIYTILLSVAALMIDSVEIINQRYAPYLTAIEWFFTLLFTIEYGARIYSSPNRWQYIKSAYGIVDLLSILPSYLGLYFTDITYLLVIRLLRVLRIFRVLKLIHYLDEANVLIRSLFQARRKISVFFFVVIVFATIFGSIMYVVEGPANGFTSIPRSIYWTIVTITTVGYGDITPQTPLGQVVASLAMLTGYSIIAVPTGIVTAELAREMRRDELLVKCPNCGKKGHEREADYCSRCGSELNKPTEDD